MTATARVRSGRLLSAIAVASIAGSAIGQTNWIGPSGNDPSSNWFTVGNWNNGLPTLAVDATIDPGNAFISVSGAGARSLVLGNTSALSGGNLSVSAGTAAMPGLRVMNQLTIAETVQSFGGMSIGINSPFGYVRIGSGIVGRRGNGSLEIAQANSRLHVDTNLDVALDGRAGVGGQTGLLTTLQNAGVYVTDRLRLGVASGSRGIATISSGFIYANSIRLGRDPAEPMRQVSQGIINVGAGGNPPLSEGDAVLAFTSVIHVGDENFAGGLGSINLNPSVGRVAGIVGVNADFSPNMNSMVIVNGSFGRVVGDGRINARVRYRSDPLFGPTGDQTVDLEFGHDRVRRSTAYAVTPGLTRANVRSGGTPGVPGYAAFVNGGGGNIGPQRPVPARPADTNAQGDEKVATLTARMLPNTTWNISWGDAFSPSAPNFLPAASAAEVPKITVPVDVAAQPANIRPRLRMWQIGSELRTGSSASPSGALVDGFPTPGGVGFKQGEIRNITDSIDAANNKVIGRTQNAGGLDFDIAVGGIATTPRHQDPRIAALHSQGLRGTGVVMGQIELGLPMLDHGCFDDWSSNTITDRRLSFSVGFGPGGSAPAPANTGGAVPAHANTSPHATGVAGIMVGYDLLGIQVDGQSRFENQANRINGGFGYTGVAPGASLVSRVHSPNTPDDSVAAMANTPGVKIINQSSGYPGSATMRPPAANGSHADEVAIDFWAKHRSLVYVKSAGNEGRHGATTITIPGGNYNGITVGNAENTQNVFYPTSYSNPGHWRVSDSSSRGPTAAPLRAKPDIVAQGTANYMPFTMESALDAGNFDPAYLPQSNRGLYSTWQRLSSQPFARVDDPAKMLPAADAVEGTSYAAPTVAGVAAIMVQRSRSVAALNAAESPLTIKSILQTSADKKTVGADRWTRGSGPGDNANDAIPLSYSWGAGLLDPGGAVNLLNAGKKNHGAAAINGDGWNLDSITADTNDAYDFPGSFGSTGHVYKLANVAMGSPFVATLNWFRDVTSTFWDGIGPPGPGQTTDLRNVVYTPPATIADLDLFLYRENAAGGNPILVASSISATDNLEHLWVPAIPAADNYLLRVRFGEGGLAMEQYGVSWSFARVPAPAASALLALVGVAAYRRRR